MILFSWCTYKIWLLWFLRPVSRGSNGSSTQYFDRFFFQISYETFSMHFLKQIWHSSFGFEKKMAKGTMPKMITIFLKFNLYAFFSSEKSLVWNMLTYLVSISEIWWVQYPHFYFKSYFNGLKRFTYMYICSWGIMWKWTK